MNQSFEVKGMHCDHCERAVREAVWQLDAQAVIQVDRLHHRVDVQTEQAREDVARVIAAEGYAVS
jgi:copper chaperone